MNYLYCLVAICLAIVFIYYFWATDSAFNKAASVAKLKSDAESEMGSAFIKLAMEQYQFRQLSIEQQTPAELQALIDNQDLLCEQLLERLEEIEQEQPNVTAFKLI
ncbi:hypothetical protein [Shewanella sp. MBTL60-007]|uniref:hypothetical protein n=1 Tax=Shewanella sp. MBTL60-007 TaxID=2815911 RepID=UPI001BB8F972|nr:hypothetical protein [Shewanella sp. MBTL60-007]GIU22135.1 hypothetical protein TUM3792_23850 [Shewanella sp. MBTL60-007]